MKRTEWKAIKGYEGMYEVSRDGKVKTLRRWKDAGKAKYFTKTKLLKQQTGRNGYKFIGLHKNRHLKTATVHRLVCMAFNGDPPAHKPWVNHKDGIKVNNASSNLEWVSPSENERHSYEVLGKVSGAKGRSGSVKGVHVTSKEVVAFPSPSDAIDAGVANKGIYNCLTGRSKTSKGYRWKYVGK